MRPAQPIATSAWPRRQARPKLSAMTTPTRGARPPSISARMRRAEASGSSGSSATVSGSGRLEVSMPALAQTRPWRVSMIRTPRSARRTSRLSSRISSTRAGSLPSTAASRRASAPGIAEERRRTRPSALETTFCETTTTSPSLELGAGGDQLAEGHPLVELRQAVDRDGPRSSLALISPAPSRCGLARPGARSAPG